MTSITDSSVIIQTTSDSVLRGRSGSNGARWAVRRRAGNRCGTGCAACPDMVNSHAPEGRLRRVAHVAIRDMIALSVYHGVALICDRLP